jgi:acetolactate synthase-1/2/3 large subunit
VLIDLPKDVQMADASHLPAHASLGMDAVEAPRDASLHEALALISQAQKPVIYGGGGIALGDAVQAFRTFVDATQIPTVLTLKGLGALPTQHPLNLGMLGMHGSPRGEPGGAGMRPADRGRRALRRPRHRQAGRVRAERARRAHGHRRLRDRQAARRRCRRARRPATTLTRLTLPCAAHLHGRNGGARKAWRAQCRQRAQQHAARYDAPGQTVYAPALLKRLSELAPGAIVACDVGQHQMWVAQHWRMDDPRKHLTSGALGAMGFGLPAAMGAQKRAMHGAMDAQVICVSGDGSIMMNIQELATLRRYRLPVKIVLLDNQALGMVRQWQELFFDKRYSEIDLSDNPDFAALARAFGIEALHVERAEDVDAPCRPCWRRRVRRCCTSPSTAANVWPLVPPNRNNAEMMDASPTEAAAPSPAHAHAPDAAHALPA